MSDQIFSIAEKLHIVTRRLYADDVRRHFVGEITKASADLCEVQGFAFVFNATMNRYERRPYDPYASVFVGRSTLHRQQTASSHGA